MAGKLIDEITKIQEHSETNEQFLKQLVRGKYSYLQSYQSTNLSFGIARRWNSWYPSYFNVEGGCYVLIPGDMDPEDEDNRKDTRIGVLVIDPGFKFIDILRVHYQIEPRDISAVIVTHFHPDHMAGLLEYATIMNTSRQICNIYLNETTYATFKTLQNAYISVNELLDEQVQEVMRYKTRDNRTAKISVKAIGVHHNELGNSHRSLGLMLETTFSENDPTKHEHQPKYRIGIVGDTDGHEEYIPDYIENFHKADILLLHLGTFSNKKLGRGGKHLYVDGVMNFLKLMATKCSYSEKPKIVVLSEFGLELASDNTLYKTLRPTIESYSWRLPLIFTGLYMSNSGVNKKHLSGYDGSHYFARAILDILDSIYISSQSDNHLNQAFTQKDIPELLVALSINILAFDSNALREEVRRLDKIIQKLINKRKVVNKVSRIQWMELINLLDKEEIQGKSAFTPVRNMFEDLVSQADFTISPLPGKRLTHACDLLLKNLSENIQDNLNIINYVDKLDYISQYAKSRGITNYRWAFSYKKHDGIDSLSLFWTCGLIGLYLLRIELTSGKLRNEREVVSPLIQIGKYFRDYAKPWANLLVGDIGCNFAIEPFLNKETNEREDRIMLKSSEGKWIFPEDADNYYDDENQQIIYKMKKKDQ